jgi:hypothetical protein
MQKAPPSHAGHETSASEADVGSGATIDQLDPFHISISGVAWPLAVPTAAHAVVDEQETDGSASFVEPDM